MTSEAARALLGVSTPPQPSRSRPSPGPDHEAFSALFRQLAPRVHAYARRHAPPDETDDVVAEVFAIAWRRRDILPDDPLPWLLVTARNVLRGRRRLAGRADSIWFSAVSDLAAHRPPGTDSPEYLVAERETLIHALAGCTRVEREALLLVAWDGLTAVQAAEVAGCSARAFTVRLSRARARLSAALDEPAIAAHRPSPPASTRPDPVVTIFPFTPAVTTARAHTQET
mgnify:FL=1